jgi:hypothetical protein
MMRIPLYLALAQWALLLALGVLVITAYRQLGRVLGRSGAPAELGPPPGRPAGRIAYQRLTGPGTGATGWLEPGGRPALVAFVDPTCPSCERLVGSLSAAGEAGDLDGTRVLLLTSDPPDYLQISAAFRATTLEIGRPLDDAELAPYRATATPLLVAIDAAGVVAAARTAVAPDEVRAMIAAARRLSLTVVPAQPAASAPATPAPATPAPAPAPATPSRGNA